MQKKNNVKLFWKELAKLREVKDSAEIKAIKQAQKITKQCVSSLSYCNKTEMRIAGELELEARKRGCALDAFPPIVLTGAASAIPHGVPSNKRVGKDDVLLVDVGCRFNNYCGDFSHTFYEGKHKEVRDAVEAVGEAQKAAMRVCRPGVKGKSISDKAVEVLGEYGFVQFTFRKVGLSLGHFIGLAVHDGFHSVDKTTLEKGHVFTIEPGVYVKGKYGVRFEDIACL